MSKVYLNCIIIQFGMVCLVFGQSSKQAQPQYGDVYQESTANSQEFYPVHTTDPNTVFKVIQRQFADEGAKVAFEVKSNSIVVTGTDEVHRRVKRAIRALDTTFDGDHHVADDQQIAVFSLVNSDVPGMVALLERFFADQNAVFDGDIRTNSLLARGSESTLREVEALLLKLDSDDSKPEPVQRGETQENFNFFLGLSLDTPSVAKISELKLKYEELIRNAEDLASRIHQMSENYADGHPQLQKLKLDLRTTVDNAFSMRQQQQKAEIAQLLPELQEIAGRIKRRERIKTQIIDQRVNQLLANAQSRKAPVGPVRIERLDETDVIVVRGQKDDVQRVTALINELGDVGESVARSSITNAVLSRLQSPSAARDYLKARSESEHAVSIAEANVRKAEWQIAKAKQQYAENETMFKKGYVTRSQLKDSRSTMDEAEVGLRQAKRQLDQAQQLVKLVQAEYESGIALLKSEAEVANLAYETVRAELEWLEKLFEHGATPRGVVDAKRFDAEKARARVQQVQTLLRLHYKAAADNTDRE